MTFEEELQRIDQDIRKLKIQYDLYFIGSNPKPPTDQRDAIDKMLKKYQGVHIKSLAERFLYNSLVNKFNAFSELWNKAMRVREEGARVHPLAARAAHQAALAENGGSHGGRAKGGARPAAPGDSGGSNGLRPAAAARAARHKGRPEETWRVPAGGGNEAMLKNLYQSFIAAKASVGDEKKPTYDAFAREIARQTATLKGKVNCEAIDFKIDCKDNRVSLKAKPSK
ncbi:MAG TPA: MXAN_5187 C-terminal domain-containing protein [Candidatus Polarisedimenticolia bacterium]|nr:MXAN_5187 C-terminal domain-containing protein [Candidatus Polarisedimenticolia bacterium]